MGIPFFWGREQTGSLRPSEHMDVLEACPRRKGYPYPGVQLAPTPLLNVQKRISDQFRRSSDCV